MRRMAVFVFIVALLSWPTIAVAQLQPGSTGGTIGKTDKEISGGEETEPQGRPKREAPARHPATTERSPDAYPSSCGKMVGVWSWFLNGNVTFRSDGTVVQSQSGLTGTWSCHSGHVVISWSHGFTDRLTLSSEGTHLEGTNGVVTVTGDRM